MLPIGSLIPPALPKQGLRVCTHAAMPETPRSFDRLCPGGRPFLCMEKTLYGSAVLAEGTLSATLPLPGKLLLLSQAKTLPWHQTEHLQHLQNTACASPCTHTLGMARNEGQTSQNRKSLVGKTILPFLEWGSLDGSAPHPSVGHAGRGRAVGGAGLLSLPDPSPPL